MKSLRIQRLCQAAVFAAIIYVFTAYLHVPSFNGYTHVGDGFIYLAASVLPTGYAAAAGAIGAGLADILSGYSIWAPATLIIKALTACFFTCSAPTFLCKRNYLALIPSALLCIFGYYLYESLITGNFIAPLAGVTGYITQVVLSSALYLLLGKALDKAGMKHRLVSRVEIG
jgi:uncharacterized repeat protein (TIGR04002 family)